MITLCWPEMNQRFSKFIFPLIKHYTMSSVLSSRPLCPRENRSWAGLLFLGQPGLSSLRLERERQRPHQTCPQVDEKGRTLIKCKTSHASSKGLFACRSRATPTLASRALESKSPCRKIHSPLDRLAGPEYFCTKNHNCHTIKTRK